MLLGEDNDEVTDCILNTERNAQIDRYVRNREGEVTVDYFDGEYRNFIILMTMLIPVVHGEIPDRWQRSPISLTVPSLLHGWHVLPPVLFAAR